MKRAIRALALIAVLVFAFYASLFAFAELFTEIVVLRTYDSAGSPHETRVTVIDIDAKPWVRGRPYRSWFQRIEANPIAELRRDKSWRPVEAQVSRDPADAVAFEREMLAEYGRPYRFLDFVARMSSNEVPVRLAPRAP